MAELAVRLEDACIIQVVSVRTMLQDVVWCKQQYYEALARAEHAALPVA